MGYSRGHNPWRCSLPQNPAVFRSIGYIRPPIASNFASDEICLRSYLLINQKVAFSLWTLM
jgi:hypothetical protein